MCDDANPLVLLEEVNCYTSFPSTFARTPRPLITSKSVASGAVRSRSTRVRRRRPNTDPDDTSIPVVREPVDGYSDGRAREGQVRRLGERPFTALTSSEDRTPTDPLGNRAPPVGCRQSRPSDAHDERVRQTHAGDERLIRSGGQIIPISALQRVHNPDTRPRYPPHRRLSYTVSTATSQI
jgi:hypothetical protein